MIRTIGKIVAASLIVMLFPLSAMAQNWNLYTYISTTSIIPGKAIEDLAKQIEKDSNGDLDIHVHLGGSLPIKATNITQAVSQGGTIQIADDGFPYGNVPIAGVLNLPMLLPTEEKFQKALDVMMPELKKSFAKKGVELLATYHYTLQVLWSRNRMNSFADINGMKIRVTSPQQAAFIRAFGGTPVTIGTPEVAPALQRGVVDGVITSSTGGGSIWKDLLTHTYRLGPNFFTSYIIANKKAFDSLDPKLQEKIRKTAQTAAEHITEQLRNSEKETTRNMAEHGMVVTPAKQSDIKEGIKRMEPYWKKWASEHGPETTQALERIRDAIQ